MSEIKATNLKPATLIQSTASKQRFEIIAVDQFGPLLTEDGFFKHVLIVEDLTSRWVDLFPVTTATAANCA